MPDSERLQELRRQRALAQEQLAWIEREIAAAENRAPAAPTPPAAAPPGPADPDATDPDALLAKYTAAEKNPGAATKAGCLTAFTVGRLLFGAVFAAFYFFVYH